MESPGFLPPSIGGTVWVGQVGGGTVCGGGIPAGWLGAAGGAVAGAFQLDLTGCAAALPTACIVGDQPAVPGYAPCGCYVGPWWGVVPPPRCVMHGGLGTAAPSTTTTTDTLTFTPTPSTFSDADVERIARRAAELVLEALRQ